MRLCRLSIVSDDYVLEISMFNASNTVVPVSTGASLSRLVVNMNKPSEQFQIN